MSASTRLVAAGFLIAVPILFNVFYTLLSIQFDYPDILRQPAGEVLRRFDEGGTGLVVIWYGFALSAALFLPAAVLLRRVFGGHPSSYLDLATPLAVLASLSQLLGLIRWPLLVPSLARTYLDPASDESTRAATLAVFRAFHQYAGVAVGEHLGYLFTAGWTVVIGGAMLTSLLFPRWLAGIGMVAAGGILIGLLEPAGLEVAGTINAFSYILWSLWLIGTGVFVLRAPSPETDLQQAQPSSAQAPAVEAV